MRGKRDGSREAGGSGHVEVPKEVRRALARFRARVRLVRSLGGVGITVALGAVLLGASVALDRMLLVPAAARLLITASTLAGVALAAFITIVLPLLRPIPARRAARGIEAALPSLEERLITTLELSEDGTPPGTSERLVEALARSTAGRLEALDVGRLVGPGQARVGLGLGAAALVGLILYAAWDLPGFGLLLNRFLHPGRDLPRPSRVALEVLPGNAVIGIDDDLLVTARITRGSPASASVRFRVPGGEWRDGAMERVQEPAPGAPAAPSRFRHEFRRARQTFEYQVVAGDALSGVHRVEVRERPRPEAFTVTYLFPPYTARPPRTSTSPRGELSAVVGSLAELTVACSGRPVSARLLHGERGERGEVPLAVEAGSSGETLVRARIDIQKNGSYRLHLEDAHGVSNRGRDAYPIHAEADRPPRVRVLSPRTAEVVVEEATRLEVQYQAEDDFGVEELVLIVGSLKRPSPPLGPPGTSREHRLPIPLDRGPGGGGVLASGSYRWDLAPLGLGPGESIPFRLEARDGLGQIGATPEMLVRVAYLPDPPEGARWLSGLRDLERGLVRAGADWEGIVERQGLGAPLGMPGREGPGGERPAPAPIELAPDPAVGERLGRTSEELLKTLAALRGLGQAASGLGRSIPIPSVNRAALAHLDASLRRFAEEEGKALWTEVLAASGAIHEKLSGKPGARQGVPAAGLHAACERSLMRLGGILRSFRAIHRAERVESALERARALLASEEEVAARAGDLAAAGTGARADAGESASRVEALWTALAGIQRVVRAEATALGGELEAISRPAGKEDAALGLIARSYQGSVAPALESVKGSLEAREAKSLLGALGASTRALRDSESNLLSELERSEAAAREARAALAASPDLAGWTLALARAEAAALEALEKEGLSSVPRVAAEDPERRLKLHRLGSELKGRAEVKEEAEPADFESTGDLVALESIFRDLKARLEDALKRTEELHLALADPAWPETKARESLAAVVAERRRAAEALDGLARALAGVEPAVELGRSARRLEAIAQTSEALAWRLRAVPPSHRRSLRALSGVGRELSRSLEETALWGFGRGSSTGATPALDAARVEISRAASASREAAARALEGDPPAALSSFLETARRAGEASRRVDEAREEIPGLAAARTWIRRRLGSLPERVDRLSREERAHAEGLEAMGAQAEGDSTGGAVPPLAAEQVASSALDQEMLRGEAAQLAAAVAREAGGDSLAPRGPPAARRGAGADHHLDLAADRILEVSQGEMLRALRAIEAASLAQDARSQRKLLGEAAASEKRAAEELARVAEALRLLDEREAAALASADLEGLLAGAPSAGSRVASLERALEEARAFLAGVLRAAEILAARIPAGVMRAELLDHLHGAAEKFRAALDAAPEGAEAVSQRVLEGRALLGAAIALVRRIRGEAEAALARSEARSRPSGPLSRELEEIRREMMKLRELRDRQAEIEAEIDELLREPGREGLSEKLQELARLDQALAEELDARFLTSNELLELVADLLAAGNEARRIAGEERLLLKDLEARERGAAFPPAARQDALIADGEGMARKVRTAGVNLTINLPAVLKPFREAEVRLEPGLEAMRAAREALAGAEPVAAGGDLKRAAAEMELLADLLGAARQRALLEIAERDEGGAAVDFAPLGLEEAMESLRQAARELSGGRPGAAQALHQSASRGILSAAEALRARLDRIRQGGEGISVFSPLDGTVGGAGRAWEVLLRGDEPREEGEREKDQAGARDPLEETGDAFPEEYRELARIYLRALAEGR